MISPHPPEPVLQPWNFQRWSQMTFLHWRCDPAEVAPLLPERLTVETCDGSAWVSVLAFVIEKLRPPLIPALPWLSRFPEVNLRTYVRGPGGQPGIWFFSLDAARLAAVLGARLTYGLPYFWSGMRVTQRGNRLSYVVNRHGSQARASIEVEVGEAYAPEELSDLDHFLTARFRLYASLYGKLAFAQAEHAAWQLFRAEIVDLRETLRVTHGLPSAGEPLVQYSPGVDVRISRPYLL